CPQDHWVDIMRNGIRLIAAFAAIAIFWCCFSVAQDEQPSTLIPISASDIGKKYVVIGPLGKPLGQLMNVEAEAVSYPRKGDSHLLRILSIDGKNLSEPVEMPFAFLRANIERLDVGHRCKLRIFQDGGFVGYSNELLREIGPAQTSGYHFRTKAVVIKSF